MKKISHILIIDDDPIHNYLCRKVISKMNVCDKIHFESNGLEGIKYLKKLIEGNKPLPEIILVDVYMPVLDGFGFIERFEKLPYNGKDVPYIAFISASEKSKEHKKMDQLTRFISKPIDVSKLEEILFTVSNSQNIPSTLNETKLPDSLKMSS